MKQRKTLNRDLVVTQFNKLISDLCDRNQSESAVRVAMTLEAVLMEMNDYRGFQYVDWENGGCAEWVKAGQPDFPEKDKFFGNQAKLRYL